MNKTKIGVALLVLIMVLGFGINYLIEKNARLELQRIRAQEQKELAVIKAREEEERLKETKKQISIDLCLDSAYENYKSDWNSACEIRNEKDDCTLPSYRANELGDHLTKRREECYKRYK